MGEDRIRKRKQWLLDNIHHIDATFDWDFELCSDFMAMLEKMDREFGKEAWWQQRRQSDWDALERRCTEIYRDVDEADLLEEFDVDSIKGEISSVCTDVSEGDKRMKKVTS